MKQPAAGPEAGERPEATRALRDQILDNQHVLDELNRKLARKTEEVKIIQQISSGILATLDLNLILKQILEATDTLLGFRHAMILLADDTGESLRLAAARGYGDAGVGAVVPVGVGPLGMVARKRRILRLGNIQSQMAYQASVRAKMEATPGGAGLASPHAMPGLAGAQSQIGIPLVVQERLVGVFAVESAAPSAFDELDEMLLSIVANQVATAIANARLHEAEKERVRELARFNAEMAALNETLESKVAERTAEMAAALETVQREQALSANLVRRMAPVEVIPEMLRGELGARRLNISVVFTDLVGFTSYSSGLEPDEIYSQLNYFFGWAGDVIGRYRGYVNKTVGDSVMALFGVPNGNSTHAIDAVLAALTLQMELPQKSPLPMRVGVNSGPVTTGMLGPADKSLYDVLGDAVNVASRMEHISDAGAVSISRETYNLVAPYFEIEALGEQEIKGKGRMERFRVIGIKNLAQDERRVDRSSVFARDFLPLVDEVYAFRRKRFPMIDFLSVQARDGALSHNEAVASFALAVLRYLKGRGEGSAEWEAVSEESVLSLALLHDIGKHAMAPRDLNLNYSDAASRERMRGELLAHTLDALRRLERDDLLAPMEELYRFEASRGGDGAPAPLVEIVAVADIYDALTAPKLYKGMPWRIRGALEELLRLPHCLQAARPVFGAFVDLLKPEGVHIAPRATGQVLFQ
jgi:adenylate cyclase